MNKKIKRLIISTAPFSKLGARRSFSIEGDTGAGFMLQVVRASDNRFYNFTTKSFDAADYSSGVQNVLKKTVGINKFTGTILFPSNASGDSYRIVLMADHSTKTEIEGYSVITLDVVQLADVTVTFNYKTANTAKYSANPPIANKTSIGSPAGIFRNSLDTSGTFSNATTASNAFGLRLIRQPVESDIVFIKATTLDGATTGSATLTVDSITDISIGMLLVTGPNLVGTPAVVNVDIPGKLVELSTLQTLNSDAADLVFEAQGSKSIFNAIGAVVAFTGSAFANVITKKTRATGSNANVALNNTAGIAGGGHVTVDGINFINSAANTIQEVTEDHDGSGTDGVIEMEVNQTTALAVNTVLTFKGSSQTIGYKGVLEISKYPSTNRTITLKLDNFITPGAAS